MARLKQSHGSALFVALLCVSSVGCTGGDDTAPVTSIAPVTTVTPVTLPTTVPAPDVSIATNFFSTIAQRTSVTTNAALQFAMPDSAAARFVLHQAAVLRLAPATQPARSVATATGFSICDSDEVCVFYDNLDIDPTSGLVAGFDIDGIPLIGRVVADGPPGNFEGGTITVTSAYRSNAGVLTIVVTIANTSAVNLTPFSFSATYQSGMASASVETSGALGPDLIPAGSVAEVLLVFNDGLSEDAPVTEATFGGQVRMSALRSDDIDLLLEAAVPSA